MLLAQFWDNQWKFKCLRVGSTQKRITSAVPVPPFYLTARRGKAVQHLGSQELSVVQYFLQLKDPEC